MGGNMMSVYRFGYSPSEVENLLRVLKVFYDEIVHLYGYDFQNKIIVPLSEAWYAPENKDIMQPKIDELKKFLRDFYVTVENFVELMNAAAQHWAIKVGDTWCNVTFSESGNILDGSVFKDMDASGTRAVMPDKVLEVFKELSEISLKTNNSIDVFKVNISGAEAFDGFDQMQILIEKLIEMGKSLITINESLNNEIYRSLSDIIEKYKSTAQTNAQKFSEGN